MRQVQESSGEGSSGLERNELIRTIVSCELMGDMLRVEGGARGRSLQGKEDQRAPRRGRGSGNTQQGPGEQGSDLSSPV